MTSHELLGTLEDEAGRVAALDDVTFGTITATLAEIERMLRRIDGRRPQRLERMMEGVVDRLEGLSSAGADARGAPGPDPSHPSSTPLRGRRWRHAAAAAAPPAPLPVPRRAEAERAPARRETSADLSAFASADAFALGAPTFPPRAAVRAASSTGLGGSSLPFAGILLILGALAVPRLWSRLPLAPALWRPVAFVSLLERPG